MSTISVTVDPVSVEMGDLQPSELKKVRRGIKLVRAIKKRSGSAGFYSFLGWMFGIAITVILTAVEKERGFIGSSSGIFGVGCFFVTGLTVAIRSWWAGVEQTKTRSDIVALLGCMRDSARCSQFVEEFAENDGDFAKQLARHSPKPVVVTA